MADQFVCQHCEKRMEEPARWAIITPVRTLKFCTLHCLIGWVHAHEVERVVGNRRIIPQLDEHL